MEGSAAVLILHILSLYLVPNFQRMWAPLAAPADTIGSSQPVVCGLLPARGLVYAGPQILVSVINLKLSLCLTKHQAMNTYILLN
jgi:hypothetical protein